MVQDGDLRIQPDRGTVGAVVRFVIALLRDVDRVQRRRPECVQDAVQARGDVGLCCTPSVDVSNTTPVEPSDSRLRSRWVVGAANAFSKRRSVPHGKTMRSGSGASWTEGDDPDPVIPDRVEDVPALAAGEHGYRPVLQPDVEADLEVRLRPA